MPDLYVERLKTYSAEDAAEIGRLMPQLSANFSDDPIQEDVLRAVIESPHHEQLVARASEKIVGAAALSLIMGAGARQKAWLEGFVSDKNSGIKGVGQALWDEMIVWCEEKQADLVFTSHSSREAAHAFYLKQGAYIRDTTVFKKDI